MRLAIRFEDGSLFLSDKSGIGDLLNIAKHSGALNGAYAADSIVGRAAALLYVRAMPEYLYAQTLSKGGAAILEKNGILFSYRTLTESIVNREGTGPCPMDDAVSMTNDPDEAYVLIKERVALLKKNAGK